MIRRKFVWLMILMIWVGMVTSIMLYQSEDYLASDRWEEETGKIRVDGELIDIDELDFPDITMVDRPVEEEQEIKEDSDKEFFQDYKLERDQIRSKQIERYREMINSPNYGEAAREQAQKKMLELTDKMEGEMEIESLIRARNFNDALAFIHDDSVDVIVETDGLKENDVKIIGDIIVKTTGFNFDDVTIIEKKLSE